MQLDSRGTVDDRTRMNNTRDHIVFFFAQKMYYLERIGKTEAYNRLIDLFEQINLDGLLNYLTRYYSIDIARELDDFFLEEGEADIFDTLTLRMKYEDGFVAYLNGQEIARRNEPGSLQWNSAAKSDRPIEPANSTSPTMAVAVSAW